MVDAGKCPRCRDYSPTDVATLLQSGGVELLDPKTLSALCEVESNVRGWVASMARDEKLSDQLIVPNVEQPSDFFYDEKNPKALRILPKGVARRRPVFHGLGKTRNETAETDSARAPEAQVIELYGGNIHRRAVTRMAAGVSGS
jgi:hypothetical protein